MSSAAEIRFEPPDPAVALLVEPRLLKLALFNLFGNAQDAIRRLPSELQNAARIEVQILMGHDKKDVRIRVADSGPGIRTPDGRLANEEEIVRIFELGYTTKPGGQGEGLGLSWVRTILTEFHPGELTASNRTEGGAVFEWRIPSDWRPSSPGKRDHTE
jgi:C4-dicarboxylate-specific signal transduction histidine kinase